jgi:uncharacterized HhH-GPD family protein
VADGVTRCSGLSPQPFTDESRWPTLSAQPTGGRVRQDRNVPTLRIAQDTAADELLGRDPLALLIGMLLDQQFPMERAFGAPRLLADRLGVEELSAAQLAECDPEVLQRHFQGPPALHRYPGSMAKRTQALSAHLVDNYDGRAEGVWEGVATGDELLARVVALPGFGIPKARIFVGLLGKRLNVRPPGWEAAAADWPSIADVDSFERILEIREQKRAMKAAAKAATATARGAPAPS